MMAALKPPQPTIVKKAADWVKICEKALATPTPEQVKNLALRNKCFDIIFKK